MSAHRPQVGDEVEYGDGRRALVTDIRKGRVWLRAHGRQEWEAPAEVNLTVVRTRTERITAGDLW
ncbi:hypothetical protein AB0C96_18285 [Streptomyces sp. NPDC048506]|uniref:hypothetical protein n=1 Tax=Streptomyces sp. NPDC048506 TaxID=3155028 RepID=UPI003424B9B4